MKTDKLDTLLISIPIPVKNFENYNDMIFLVFEDNGSRLFGYFTFEFWEEANDKIYYKVMQWKDQAWVDLGNMSIDPTEIILQDDLLTFLKVVLTIETVNKKVLQDQFKPKPAPLTAFEKLRTSRLHDFEATLAKWTTELNLPAKRN